MLCLCLVLGLLSSCSRPFTQVNVSSREAYRSSSFKGVEGTSVAILTAIGSGSGTEYRKLIGEIVENAVRDNREDIEVLPYWEGLSIINREGLSNAYSEMLKIYSVSGILDRDTLLKIQNVLGVDYFIQPRLVSYTMRRSGRWSLAGVSLLKTHETGVRLYFELWNGATGEVEWIGAGSGRFAQEHYRAKPIPFEPVATEAIRALINEIPKNGDKEKNNLLKNKKEKE